ncbi:MAG: hypothetical protein AAF936_08935 [Pseudomonadota bacterium]
MSIQESQAIYDLLNLIAAVVVVLAFIRKPTGKSFFLWLGVFLCLFLLNTLIFEVFAVRLGPDTSVPNWWPGGAYLLL